jgi:hypothetical protein
MSKGFARTTGRTASSAQDVHEGNPDMPASMLAGPQAAGVMKNAFGAAMGSGGGGGGGGGDSVVRFAEEVDSQPSSKGTTALLKDGTDTEQNPSYMTNCRMQMLIMEEPPEGARSADYVCYLRASMDAMRGELHAVMEQTHKAQAWMKRRERLLELQQGLLTPVTNEMFVFSAPWERLRARFEGASRAVAWNGLPSRYHFLRAKGADVALLEEAVNELFKVIWRRASSRTHADIDVSMLLQPTFENGMGAVVAPSLAGIVSTTHVLVPSAISHRCFGCLPRMADEGAVAGHSASHSIQESDEVIMMDDTYGDLSSHREQLIPGQWFRFVIVVRFVDRGPAATRLPSRPGDGDGNGSGTRGAESDSPIEHMQRQLESNSQDAFPLNDDEYVGVQVAREAARLHGGRVSFKHLAHTTPSSHGGRSDGGRVGRGAVGCWEFRNRVTRCVATRSTVRIGLALTSRQRWRSWRASRVMSDLNMGCRSGRMLAMSLWPS